ncbi:hypothetical protein BN1058_01249 [Paraliobacillus sp. PM-2]|uniref:hypothetical protein n=1 Tax=Paraliobacillus sp. PM-2 TaxID=1462524 RepID=UPI00061C2B3B|nr:hypothetical protein [Paraliobacillus sp. PM-2]CQR46962.1 hypothetical protein BN1058_01249 [Paraliobacillus sp. PM-2]
MGESNDCEALPGQQILEQENAIDRLEHFKANDKEYYVVYQKENQRAKRELKFNKVNKRSDDTFAIAMHTEDKTNAIRYYHGEEIILSKDEIIQLRIIDPGEYDFVVYTD